jgi:hypothetical protein
LSMAWTLLGVAARVVIVACYFAKFHTKRGCMTATERPKMRGKVE